MCSVFRTPRLSRSQSGGQLLAEVCVLLPKARVFSRKDRSLGFSRFVHAVTRRHRLKAIEGRVVTWAADCVTPQKAGVTQPPPRCGRAAWVGPCFAPGRLLRVARVAARNAGEPGTGWTPVTGRLGARCRMGRPEASLSVAPCRGKVTCFTVGESHAMAASFAIGLAGSCGRVSGRAVNKAMGPPSGSDNDTDRLQSAPTSTGNGDRLRSVFTTDAQTAGCDVQRECRLHAGLRRSRRRYGLLVVGPPGWPGQAHPGSGCRWRRSNTEWPRRTVAPRSAAVRVPNP